MCRKKPQQIVKAGAVITLGPKDVRRGKICLNPESERASWCQVREQLAHGDLTASSIRVTSCRFYISAKPKEKLEDQEACGYVLYSSASWIRSRERRCRKFQERPMEAASDGCDCEKDRKVGSLPTSYLYTPILVNMSYEVDWHLEDLEWVMLLRSVDQPLSSIFLLLAFKYIRCDPRILRCFSMRVGRSSLCICQLLTTVFLGLFNIKIMVIVCFPEILKNWMNTANCVIHIISYYSFPITLFL